MRAAFASGLAMCLLLVALPSTGAATVVRGKTSKVAASGGPHPFTWAWDPADISIARADRVGWTNPTSASHHITAWDGPWEAAEHLDAGTKVSLRFKKPGIYKYWCDIFGHADIVFVGTERICVGMCGVITVE